MKRILLMWLMLLMLAGVAYAYCSTDWGCVNECTARGQLYSWCKSFCTACY